MTRKDLLITFLIGLTSLSLSFLAGFFASKSYQSENETNKYYKELIMSDYDSDYLNLLTEEISSENIRQNLK